MVFTLLALFATVAADAVATITQFWVSFQANLYLNNKMREKKTNNREKFALGKRIVCDMTKPHTMNDLRGSNRKKNI